MPFDSQERSPCRDCPTHLAGESKAERFDPELATYETTGQYLPKQTGKLIPRCHDCPMREAYLSIGIPTYQNPKVPASLPSVAIQSLSYTRWI
jgi:hypothetical protein